MAHTDPFLLGPVGAMTPLPGIVAAQGVGVVHERVGPGMTVGLRGGASLDVRAVKREYTFAWPLAARGVADRLAMRWRGTTTAPLRLLDPFAPNLLTADASMAGAVRRDAQVDDASWAAGIGAASIAVSASDLTGTPVAGLVDRVARWDAVAGYTVAADFQVPRWAPLLGRPLTFSFYARGSGTIVPRIYLWTANNASYSTMQAAPAVLSQTWQRIAVTVSAGRTERSANTEIACTAAGTVQLTALQLEHAAAPTAWSPGGGCPTVTVAGFGDGYRALGYRALELTLREV